MKSISGLILMLLAAPVFAQTTPDERPYWQRTYEGRLADQPVMLILERFGRKVTGSLCRPRCDGPDAERAALNGTVQGEVLELSEATKTSPPAAARWTLRIKGSGTRGLRRAGGRDDAFDGRHAGVPAALADIRLVTDTPEADASGLDDDTCPFKVPTVTAIRLYRDGRLHQQLDIPDGSTGTCQPFTPDIGDFDFDGHPDISIALMLPAGPNIPYRYWLYSPAQDRFVEAPSELQEITSARFDPIHRIVYSPWRGSCCSHGIDVYRWRDGTLESIGSYTSHSMPLRVGGKLGFAYVMPVYDNGQVTENLRVIRGQDGRYRLEGDIRPEDLDEAPPTWSQDLTLQIWSPVSSTLPPGLLETWPLEWVRHGSHTPAWCPRVSYLDVDTGRIAAHEFGREHCLEAPPGD